MLKYRRVLELDNELYQFHLRQKGYYMLQEIIPTKEYLINDMVIPDGFDEVDHFIYKVYFKNEMVGLIDYQLGYRFSMIHDDKCLWIGLFLVDESYQRKMCIRDRVTIRKLIQELSWIFYCETKTTCYARGNNKALASG